MSLELLKKLDDIGVERYLYIGGSCTVQSTVPLMGVWGHALR